MISTLYSVPENLHNLVFVAFCKKRMSVPKLDLTFSETFHQKN